MRRKESFPLLASSTKEVIVRLRILKIVAPVAALLNMAAVGGFLRNW